MKKTIAAILIISIILSCTTSLKISQKGDSVAVENLFDTVKRLSDFKKDTIAYLRYLQGNKEKYINQPLDGFLKDLEIPIISFSAAPTLLKSENKTISLFTDEATMFYSKLDTKSNTAIEIIIDWQSTQPMIVRGQYMLRTERQRNLRQFGRTTPKSTLGS